MIAANLRADRRRTTQPACLTVRGDRADRLRQLGASRRTWTVPEHGGLRRLHRAPRAQRHRRRQPDPVRRARRREPLRRRRADLRRDLAGLQHLRRQQPLQVHGRVPARQPARPTRPRTRSPTTGRSTADATTAAARCFCGRRVPDDPLPRGATATTSATSSSVDVDRTPALLQNHKLFISSGHDEYWSAPQRSERRGRARRRRQPRLLQRQRGVLEDALGAERRRHRHAGPHARLLQGHALRRARPGPGRRGPARGATRASRTPADGGTPENALTGQSFLVNSGTAGITVPSAYRQLRLWRNTAVASLAAGPDA